MGVHSTMADYQKQLDPNTYSTKKTVAQGMLDIALLSANASQLRYVLEVGDSSDNYLPMLLLIVASIILQVLNGLSQLVMGSLNLNKEEYSKVLNILNYISMGLSYGIMAVDALKTIFGLEK